jgi:hypothetical protein
MIAPQTAAPPRRAWATTGPSSIQGAQVIRLKNANCTVTAHSQVRDLNSAQPSAMSRHSIRRSPWPPEVVAPSRAVAPSLAAVWPGSLSSPRASTLTA